MNEDPTQALQDLENSAQPLMTWIAEVRVTSPDEQKNAEDLLISARAALRTADEKRRDLTRPLDEAKRRIIDLFNPYVSRLETAISMLNRELTSYHQGLVALQQEEERRAMEEQAARMREAAETGEVVDLPEALSVPNVNKTSHAHMGTVTYREDWDIQVVDPVKVPRDLCQPSLPLIRARVRSGITNISGVLVIKRLATVARS